MRILIISWFFPPLNSIACRRPYSWARYWSEAGNEITVLTVPKTRDIDGSAPRVEGFEVIEVPEPAPVRWLRRTAHNAAGGERVDGTARPMPFARLLLRKLATLQDRKGVLHSCRMPDLADGWVRPAIRSTFRPERGSWDVAVSTFGPYATHWIGAELKRRRRVRRWVADFRDPWVDHPVLTGLFPFNHLEKWLERKWLRHADILIAVSAPLAGAMRARHPGKRVEVIENGYDADDLPSLPDDSVFPDDGKFRVVYTGSLYPDTRDLGCFFKALIALDQDPRSRSFLDRMEVVFAGPSSARLSRMVNEHGVRRWVRDVGLVDRREAHRMQRDADVLLLVGLATPGTDGFMTGKSFEYLATGRPILAIGFPESHVAAGVIRRAGAGICLDDPVQIKEYLLERASRPGNRIGRLPDPGLWRYERRHLAGKLLRHMERLAGDSLRQQ
jgi:glycosyltransferase involved in cell wall biosynthesis